MVLFLLETEIQASLRTEGDRKLQFLSYIASHVPVQLANPITWWQNTTREYSSGM